MEMDESEPIHLIQNAKHQNALGYIDYALKKMIEREITSDQVEEALNSNSAEILRNYPQAGRPSPECLILGWHDSGRRPLHVLVAYPEPYVVTAYEPTLPKWRTPRERGE